MAWKEIYGPIDLSRFAVELCFSTLQWSWIFQPEKSIYISCKSVGELLRWKHEEFDFWPKKVKALPHWGAENLFQTWLCFVKQRLFKLPKIDSVLFNPSQVPTVRISHLYTTEVAMCFVLRHSVNLVINAFQIQLSVDLYSTRHYNRDSMLRTWGVWLLAQKKIAV
jgi:hypothetical protein